MEIETNISKIRRKVSSHLVKGLILGEANEVNSHQYEMVMNKLSDLEFSETPDDRTWISWLSGGPIKPHYVEKLGEWAQAATKWRYGGDWRMDKGYFQGMIHGGLVKSILKTTKSKHVHQLLMERARKYSSMSSLHLHLDALETNSIVDDFYEVSWCRVTEIAANKIFEILSNRWGPRNGSIYPQLPSSLKMRWEAADSVERKKIEDSYKRWKPNLFEYEFHRGARPPDWNSIGIDSSAAPQHIYKTLFSMAADPSFLVGERLEVWCLDMATAALAMKAHAWTDRYKTMGVHITQEMIFTGAFDYLFFSSEEKRDERFLYTAMDRCQAEWSDRSLEIFHSARAEYLDMMGKLGMSISDLAKVFDLAHEVHPLIYYGDWKPGSDKLGSRTLCRSA